MSIVLFFKNKLYFRFEAAIDSRCFSVKFRCRFIVILAAVQLLIGFIVIASLSSNESFKAFKLDSDCIFSLKNNGNFSTLFFE